MVREVKSKTKDNGGWTKLRAKMQNKVKIRNRPEATTISYVMTLKKVKTDHDI